MNEEKIEQLNAALALAVTVFPLGIAGSVHGHQGTLHWKRHEPKPGTKGNWDQLSKCSLGA